MTQKSQSRVTLREFRAAFNAVARGLSVLELEMPKGFKRALESVFPSKDLASSVTARQFYDHAHKIAIGDYQPRKGRVLNIQDTPEDDAVTRRLGLGMQIMTGMPAMRAYFEVAGQERKTPRREKPETRAAKAPSLEDRVAALERENAALRNSQKPSAEEDARVRQWYADNDTRIGGSHDPGPVPGLRD